MTTIQSTKAALSKSAEEVFAFLADANNHQQLMPSNVYNWSSTTDDCKFTIQNMAKLHLAFSERTAPSIIKIVPIGEVPFKIDLQWNVESNGSGSTAQLTINADLNPFIKMMAMGPLTNLVNHQTEQLQKVLA